MAAFTALLGAILRPRDDGPQRIRDEELDPPRTVEPGGSQQGAIGQHHGHRGV